MKVIFLDRDGVINKYPGNFEYVKSWEEFSFLPAAIPALKRLRENGYALFVVSNQAGVAKGIYSQKTLDLITGNMLDVLKENGVDIAGVYYCTHLPDENCPCRKPRAGLVHKASDALKKEGDEITPEESYFIGDSIRDVETGKAVGVKTILVFSGREKPENRPHWQVSPDYTAQDLADAVEIVFATALGK